MTRGRFSPRRALAARLRREESGAVLVVVAVSMVFMIGCGAIAIDVGQWYQQHRQAQAAADAGALAAVQDLPDSTATAVADAQSYVTRNLPGASATVTTPYGGSATTVQVTVTTHGAIWLGQIFGISAPTITATAVAQRSPGAVHYLVFAYDSTCGDQSLLVNGNNNVIDGAAHSNGDFFQNANNTTYSFGSYGGPNGCSFTGNGQHNAWNGAPAPIVDPVLEPWPVDYSKMTIPCTHTATNFDFNTQGQTLSPGVYCASGRITINANNLTGNVSFIANSFVLNGNNEAFTPFFDNLTAYQTGPNQLLVNGNNFVNLGTVFAPNATIVLNSNNGTVTGFVEGLDVLVNGNNATYVGTGPIASGTLGTLIG